MGALSSPDTPPREEPTLSEQTPSDASQVPDQPSSEPPVDAAAPAADSGPEAAADSEPDAPARSEPEAPARSEPEAPARSEPEAPARSEPEAPADSGEAPDPAPSPAGHQPRSEPPGLREQAARTVAAGRRLLTAHLELARAELSAILGEVGRLAAAAGIAIALLAYIALLVPVGAALFLGELVFGSMGWGILHGTLAAAAAAVIAVLAALRVAGGYLARTLVGAIVLGAAVGVVLGLAWPHAAYDALGLRLAPGVDSAIRPLVVGAALWAVIGGVAGLVGGVRFGGGGRAWGGLAGGAVLGVLFGAFTAIAFPVQVGAALGLTVTLIAWPALAALALRDHDWDALKRRFVPQASIDAARETRTFLDTRLPRRGSAPAKEDEG